MPPPFAGQAALVAVAAGAVGGLGQAALGTLMQLEARKAALAAERRAVARDIACENKRRKRLGKRLAGFTEREV